MNKHSHMQAPAMGSERSFGAVFGAVFALIALAPLCHGENIRLWALGIAAVFVMVAIFKADLLRPFNLLWFRFGLLLNRIMSPLIMTFLFFAVVTPAGLLMRLSGKDPLRLKRGTRSTSYWVFRDPPGPLPESMKNQF